jgi:hypothetical protein
MGCAETVLEELDFKITRDLEDGNEEVLAIADAL